MRKIILSFITFMGFFSLSHGFEANVKFGYDFFRQEIKIHEKTKSFYERGFVLGVEVLPLTFKNERIKLGAGVEYNFGELFYYGSNISITRDSDDFISMIPLYATAKFTYYRPKNIDLNLYTFVRLGYAFSEWWNEFLDENDRDDTIHGIYYGLGLGIDYKYFLAEILYDGKYTNSLKGRHVKTYSEIYHPWRQLHHKVGVRIGFQIGTQHFKKPEIIKK